MKEVGENNSLTQRTTANISKTPKARNHEDKVPSSNGVSEAFNAYYMQKVAAEFADDLDHIRNADDFSDTSLPMLVNALQAGAAIFSEEDRKRIVSSKVKG